MFCEKNYNSRETRKMSNTHHLIPSVVAIAISKFWAPNTGTPSTFFLSPCSDIVFSSLLAALTWRESIYYK